MRSYVQAPSLNQPGESGLTQREEMETNLIRALIASYFSIVRQTVKDLVPKAIMRTFYNFSFTRLSSLPKLIDCFFRLVGEFLERVSSEPIGREFVQG